MPDQEHQPLLSRQDIEQAHERIRPHAHRTPVLRCGTFERRFGGELYFKCENLQKVGAFKFRGAMNAVSQLSAEQRERGVTTHSSGNHAQALALAARIAGTRARIVMPRTAPAVKLAAVRGYGAEVILCEPTLKARETTTAEVIEETGAVLVHPYNDRRVVAGQATAAKELIEDCPPLDLILVPVGGGGLASGTVLSARYFSPDTTVIGVEPEAADDAFRSLQTGELQPPVTPTRSIADGLLSALGEVTFGVLSRHLHSIVTVSEESIIDAMRLIWERMKIIVEPSGAVPFAAVLSGKIDVKDLKVGVILSGGNVDLGKLPWASG